MKADQKWNEKFHFAIIQVKCEIYQRCEFDIEHLRKKNI